MPRGSRRRFAATTTPSAPRSRSCAATRPPKLVVDALAAAATPAAQDALCELARDRRLTPAVRAGAVASLGLLRRPTAATMTAVAELIRAK